MMPISYTDSNRKIIIIFQKNQLKYLHISNKCIIFVVEKETTKTITTMTVKELIDKLNQIQQDLDIELDDGTLDFVIKDVSTAVSGFDLKTKVCYISLKRI